MKISQIKITLQDASVTRACLVLPLGSAIDPGGKSGLTHVLEHCLYAQVLQVWQDGQKKYALDFFTATTFRDHVEFSITVSAGDESLIDELISITTKPLALSQAEYQRELDILHRELVEQESDPDYANEQAEAEWLYSKTFQKPNGGTSASIRNIQLSDVIDWQQNLIESELLIISTAHYQSKLPLKQVQNWHNPNPIALEHTAETTQLKLVRTYGEDAVIHAFLMARVMNEGQNNHLLLLGSYLEEQLRAQADTSGDMYYYGADTFTVGSQTELSLSVTVSQEKVSYYQKFLTQLIQKAYDISEQDFIGLRDKTAKIQSIAQSDPAARFSNYCFSAITWGQTWEEYSVAEESLSSLSRTDFQEFLTSNVSALQDMKIAQIIPTIS